MKKLLTCLALCCVMALSLAMFACTDNPDTSSGHQHTFETVNKVEATCQTAGTKEHQVCLYCHKLFIDGKEVSESDIVIPIDANAHKYKDVAEKPSTCVEKGVAAHKECEVCHKLFTVDKKEVAATELELPVSATAHVYTEVAKADPADCVTAGMEAHLECTSCHKLFNAQKNEVTAESLRIAPKGAHTFDAKTHKCADCSAYQVKVGENYYAIDMASYIPFKTNSSGAHTLPKNSKSTTSGVIPKLVAEKNTFTSQISKDNSGTPSAKSEDEWLIENNVYTHTRFCYDNGTGYVGKVIFTFDITVADDVNIDKIGFNTIVHADSGVTPGVFVGAKAVGAAYTCSSLKGNVTYRFIGIAVKNAASDIFQIHTVTTNMTPIDLTIKNIHVAPIETEVGESTLYFGLATGYPVVPGVCTATADGKHVITHTAAKAETCTEAGNIDYYYCSACKTYFEDQDGTMVIDGSSVNIPATGHAKEAHAAEEASCLAVGHSAYVYCTTCKKYFTDDTCATETTYAAIYGSNEVAAHNFGTDGVCTACGVKQFVFSDTNYKTYADNKTLHNTILSEPNVISFQMAGTNPLTREGNAVTATGRKTKSKHDTNVYVRFLPSKDGTTAYTGRMLYTFDVTMLETDSGKATTDFSMKWSVRKVVTGADGKLTGQAMKEYSQNISLELNKTYRFTVEVELTKDEYVQFSFSGADVKAKLQFTNISVKYDSSTATGAEMLESKAFAAIVKEEAKPEAQA